MGMVTLVQQQQQTNDDNRQCQKEQDHANGAIVPAESHAVDKFRGEVACSVRETAVVDPGNGSVGDSSTQCSDIDDDEEEETDIEEGDGWVSNLSVSSAVVEQHQAVATTNGDVVLPNADPSNFGDVCVKNSTNVHLGNKTFYKGPVTIKQFIYTNPTPIQDEGKFETCNVTVVDNSELSTSKDVNGAPNGPIFQQSTGVNKVTQLLWTWRCAVLSCVLALILLAAIVLTIAYLPRHTDASVFPEAPGSGGIIGTSVRFVERNEWGAQPPSEPLTKLKLPVPYVIISHTVTDFCTTQSECTFRVRFAQTFHIESRGWSDIAYNFLVGGDGLAYVGRSWDYVGAHSFGFNNRSIGISFIGTFNTIKPTKAQLHAAQKVIELGVKAGKIATDYKLLGHRQVSQTLSPGDALYEIIQKWPHWSPSP